MKTLVGFGYIENILVKWKPLHCLQRIIHPFLVHERNPSRHGMNTVKLDATCLLSFRNHIDSRFLTNVDKYPTKSVQDLLGLSHRTPRIRCL